MGSTVDYKVLFAYQKQILECEKLTAEEKNEMIVGAMKDAGVNIETKKTKNTNPPK